MTYLRNCWYMAAWSGEVADAPFARRILDEPVLLYRRRDGVAVALTDRCPHRFAPLHMGKLLDGDRIQCPYHGLEFDSAGRCVFNPQGSGATPAAAALRSYPLHEKYGGLWIWMGEPERADPALIPDYGFLDDARYARDQGYMMTRANYELMADNILDLGHVDFLHQGSLGCEATAKAKPRTRQEGTRIFCDRWMPNDRQGPLPSITFERDGPVDAWIDVVWDPPSLMILNFGMTDVGGSRESARETRNIHFMTPETRFSTHYFWATCRNFRLHEPGLGDAIRAGVEAAFSIEDKPMIEAQQAMMGEADFWSLKPVLLQGDAAAVMARRTLAKLIEEEKQAAGQAMAASSVEVR